MVVVLHSGERGTEGRSQRKEGRRTRRWEGKG